MFKKKTSIPVNRISSDIIEAAQKKWMWHFPAFIGKVRDNDSKENLAYYNNITETLKKGVELCDVILGKKGIIPKDKDVQEFLQFNRKINSEIALMGKHVEASNLLQGKIKDIEKEQNMSLEMMTKTSSLISSKVQGTAQTTGGFHESAKGFGHIASGALAGDTQYSGGTGTASSLLSLVPGLAPFAPLIHYAASAATEVYKRHRERKMARQMQGGDIGLLARQAGFSESTIDSIFGKEKGGHTVSSKINGMDDILKSAGESAQGGMSGAASPKESILSNNKGEVYTGGPQQTVEKNQGGIGPSGGAFGRGEGIGKYTTNNAVAAGLKQFYTVAAFQAPYTKRLLEAVERSGGGGEGGGLFGGFGNAIKSLLPLLGRFALALAAGYALYKLLGIDLTSPKMKKEMGDLYNDVKKRGLGKALGDEWNRGAYSVFGHSKPSLGENIALGITASPMGILAAKMMGVSPDVMAVGMHSRFSGESYAKSVDRIKQYNKSEEDPNYRRVTGASGSWSGATPSPRQSVSDIVNKTQSLKNENNNGELVGALKEFAKDKSSSGSISLESGTSRDKDDPFLDYFNSGLLSEEF